MKKQDKKPVAVVGRAISPFELMAEMKKRAAAPPPTPEQAAEIERCVEELTAMGGFTVLYRSAPPSPKKE